MLGDHMTTRGVERIVVKSASLMINETETRDERERCT